MQGLPHRIRGPDGVLYESVIVPINLADYMMQGNNESSQSGGVGVIPPPTQGYAYNPLLAGQLPYYPAPPGYHYKAPHTTVDDLSNAFAGLKPVNAYSGGNVMVGGMPGLTQMAYSDGRTMYTQRNPHGTQPNPYMMPPYVPYANLPGTPNQYAWPGAQTENGEVPSLARRNSASSNEEVGPQTPFMAGQYSVDQYKKQAGPSGDSPQLWTTPSPYSLTYGTSMPQQLWKHEGEYQQADYDSLCAQDPPVPRPVPAIFSSEKSRGTLDKCLKNETNTTNVYIRGLHPNTTDEMLEAYGARFGTIMSAKSMLDQATGSCKGFGFIKYHNFDDGENCIRGFFHMGYEAKWARVSHNERLKTLADDSNTNLYISNLPMTYNEQSSKILRDENGISRGVGFARFASPDVCREIIAKYSGYQVAEGYLLSIRFADTPDQKKLKSLTAERRQFKTHEYNTAAYGPGSPYAAQVSPVNTQFANPVQPRFPSPLNPMHPVGVFSGYPPNPSYHPASVPMASKQVENHLPGSAPANKTQVSLDSPSIAAHNKRSAAKENSKLEAEEAEDREEHQTPLKNVTNAKPRTEKGPSPSKSAADNGSPARSTTKDTGTRTTPSKTPRSKRR